MPGGLAGTLAAAKKPAGDLDFASLLKGMEAGQGQVEGALVEEVLVEGGEKEGERVGEGVLLTGEVESIEGALPAICPEEASALLLAEGVSWAPRSGSGEALSLVDLPREEEVKEAEEEEGEEGTAQGGGTPFGPWVPLVESELIAGQALGMEAGEKVDQDLEMVEGKDSALANEQALVLPAGEPYRPSEGSGEPVEVPVESELQELAFLADRDLADASAALDRASTRAKPRPFDLLTLGEWMDPKLKVEPASGHLLERLQQAVAAGRAPFFEEVAQTALPQVIRGLVALVRDGTAEMRLQLQPPELGEIRLRVRTTEGAVQGQMVVQHPQVKALLETHFDRLRTALAEQGLELAGFDVSVNRDPRFAWRDNRPSGASRGRAPLPPDSPLASPVLAAAIPGRVPTGDHAVDYTI